MTEATVAMVDNQYREALVSARGRAEDQADSIATALDEARNLMSAGCWIGTRASAFGEDVGAHRQTLRSVQDRAMDSFADAVGGEPHRVEETDWRARWYQLRYVMR